MKMPYEKPMMAIERYELTQSIATCDIKIGHLGSTCVFRDVDAIPGDRQLAGVGYFIAEGSCDQLFDDLERDDGTCYHTSAGAYFTS